MKGLKLKVVKKSSKEANGAWRDLKKQETQDKMLTSSLPFPVQDSRTGWRHMLSAVSVAAGNGMRPGVRFCAVERILPKIKASLCLQLCPFKLEHHCFKCFLLCAVVQLWALEPAAKCSWSPQKSLNAAEDRKKIHWISPKHCKCGCVSQLLSQVHYNCSSDYMQRFPTCGDRDKVIKVLACVPQGHYGQICSCCVTCPWWDLTR